MSDLVVTSIDNNNPSHFRTMDADGKFDCSSTTPKTVDNFCLELKDEVVDQVLTLEDFLQAKAEADLRISNPLSCLQDFGRVEEAIVGIGDRDEITGSERRKGAAAMVPMDEAALQRQRRMIKNRESAARSREKKQVRFLAVSYNHEFTLCFNLVIQLLILILICCLHVYPPRL